MRRQCSSTESSHPAAERPPSVPPSFPSHRAVNLPTWSRKPPRRRATIPRSRAPSRSSLAICSRLHRPLMSMHLHRPVYAPLYAATSYAMAPTFACADGWRSESDPPGWSNPNNRRTLNERGPGRSGSKWRLDVSFLTRHFSAFPGNLIVHVESKDQANERPLGRKDSDEMDAR